MTIRRYENMSRNKIYGAIAQYTDMLAAIQRHQNYLASGNGLPKDELARWELQLSHGQVEEKLRDYIRELEAELAFKDQHDISE